MLILSIPTYRPGHSAWQAELVILSDREPVVLPVLCSQALPCNLNEQPPILSGRYHRIAVHTAFAVPPAIRQVRVADDVGHDKRHALRADNLLLAIDQLGMQTASLRGLNPRRPFSVPTVAQRSSNRRYHYANSRDRCQIWIMNMPLEILKSLGAISILDLQAEVDATLRHLLTR